MARYLVVANLTSESPVLREKARHLMEEDPDAEFVVLVPVHPVPARLHWMAGFDSHPIRAAGRRGRRARLRLLEIGARVVAVRVGTYDVGEAIEEELRYGSYRGVISRPCRTGSPTGCAVILPPGWGTGIPGSKWCTPRRRWSSTRIPGCRASSERALSAAPVLRLSLPPAENTAWDADHAHIPACSRPHSSRTGIAVAAVAVTVGVKPCLGEACDCVRWRRQPPLNVDGKEIAEAQMATTRRCPGPAGGQLARQDGG